MHDTPGAFLEYLIDVFVTVANMSDADCNNEVVIGTNERLGYLLGSVTADFDDVMATTDCQWRLRAPAGNTIKLTLLLFTRGKCSCGM